MTGSSCSRLHIVQGRAEMPPNKDHLRGMFGTCGCSNKRTFGIGSPVGNQERCMSKFVIRLLTLVMFSMALVTAPLVTKAYAAPDNDAPPPSSSKSKKKKTSE